MTVQGSRPFYWVVVAHLVAQSRESLTVSLRRLLPPETQLSASVYVGAWDAWSALAS